MYNLPALFACLSDNASPIVCLVLYLIYCHDTFLVAFCLLICFAYDLFFYTCYCSGLARCVIDCNKDKTSDLFVEFFGVKSMILILTQTSSALF